jgi:hypothetical protein
VDLDPICTCGHAFSNHRPLWRSAFDVRAGEPPETYRCDESDGCGRFVELDLSEIAAANLEATFTIAEYGPIGECAHGHAGGIGCTWCH